MPRSSAETFLCPICAAPAGEGDEFWDHVVSCLYVELPAEGSLVKGIYSGYRRQADLREKIQYDDMMRWMHRVRIQRVRRAAEREMFDGTDGVVDYGPGWGFTPDPTRPWTWRRPFH